MTTTTTMPVLTKSDPPKRIPDPFGTMENFMLEMATGEDTLRPYHFQELGGDDVVKQRMAIASGMNYLRHATDLEIAESKTRIVDGRTIVSYGPTEKASAFWKQTLEDGKSAKEILDGWIAFRELVESVRGKDGEEE